MHHTKIVLSQTSLRTTFLLQVVDIHKKSPELLIKEPNVFTEQGGEQTPHFPGLSTFPLLLPQLQLLKGNPFPRTFCSTGATDHRWSYQDHRLRVSVANLAQGLPKGQRVRV